jgi:hypothetical protein
VRLSHYIRHLDSDSSTATGPVPMRNGDPRDRERDSSPRREWAPRPIRPVIATRMVNDRPVAVAVARRVGGAS